jgi:ribonuclease P protein component
VISLRLPAAHRVKKRRDFVRVRQEGRTVRDSVLLLSFHRRDDDGHPRLGLAVGRRLGNAVVRNRIKRVVREVFRHHPHLFPEGVDVVVIPLESGRAQSFGDVARSLRRLAARVREQHP